MRFETMAQTREAKDSQGKRVQVILDHDMVNQKPRVRVLKEHNMIMRQVWSKTYNDIETARQGVLALELSEITHDRRQAALLDVIHDLAPFHGLRLVGAVANGGMYSATDEAGIYEVADMLLRWFNKVELRFRNGVALTVERQYNTAVPVDLVTSWGVSSHLEASDAIRALAKRLEIEGRVKVHGRG